MSIQGTPARYRRGYSFSGWARIQPNAPLPGDRLDQELDDIAYVLEGRAAELKALVGDDGRLRAHVVGAEQLAPGLFDEISRSGADRLIPVLSDALAAAERAQRAANDAGGFVATVQRAAHAAHAQAFQAEAARAAIEALRPGIEQAAVDADADEKLAKNSADTAEAYMVQAEAARDMSQTWAEYLAGPVQPAPPGWPEAIDDGMWSSKWWAVRASEIVGAWGNWYLGAFATPPTIPVTGPWPPGTLYYDTSTGQMLVWDGTGWFPMTVPGPSVALAYVYVATAGQMTFLGPDMNGATPNPSPTQASIVHVNGVRLVEDKGSGEGDFTIDRTALTIKIALDAGSIVHWDVLNDPAALAPQSANILKLISIDLDPATGTPGQIDGVRAAFPLRYVSAVDGLTHPATPGAGVQLQIVLDGVVQEVGVDYTVAGSTITFTPVLPAATRFSGAWFAPLAVS